MTASISPLNKLNTPPVEGRGATGESRRGRGQHTHTPVCMKSTLFPWNLPGRVLISDSMPCTAFAVNVVSRGMPVPQKTDTIRSEEEKTH